MGSTVAGKPFKSDAADKGKEDFSKNMMGAIQQKSFESEAADELDKSSSEEALAK